MAALLASAGPVAARAPETSLRPVGRADEFLRRIQATPDALMARARIGENIAFTVCELGSGKLLESHRAASGMPPASVAKALTAAYALETLGPGHHFETTVVATGPISETGILSGDLVLVGGGDPTLDTDALARLAADVKQMGIREVRGAFKIWSGALPFAARIDESQPDHVGYNPAVSGLNLNFNRVHFQWRRASGGYDVTMDARSETHRPEVRVARMRVAARDLPVYTYTDADGRDEWSVARGALGEGGTRWLPVRKPGLYAGEVFQTFARSHGIVLKAPVEADEAPVGEVVARQESAPLRIILRDMLKWSTNLTAEIVGLAATKARLGAMPASIRASADAMNGWAQDTYGLTTMAFVDHSGLGERSRISAGDMMTALRALRQTSGIKPLMRGFAMRDEKRRVVENHPLEVRAKTGTLNFVSGLAGFVDLPDGTELVFAIFAADLDLRAGLTREERDRPPGGAAWNVRAKKLQQALIERWGIVFAA